MASCGPTLERRSLDRCGGAPVGQSARLFVEPDGLLCRRFLGQAFLAPEIDGLMRSEEQALLALELFARFLATHRRSVDLAADVRRHLRREGIIGAIEIILHHEPRELGG